jgi:hypothetical protein
MKFGALNRRASRPNNLARVASTPSLANGSDTETAAEYRSVLAERMKYLVPVHQPLVLITQIGRSGGTLLLRLFDSHRECHVVPYELQRIFRGMEATLLDHEEAWRNLASDKQFERGRPFVLRPGLQRAIFEACLGELDDPGPRDVMNCYFTSFFNGWLDNGNLRAKPKRWVVGFEPGETTNLGGCTRVYPDGRIISLVRDPWSWYASRRKKQRKWGNVEIALDTWCAHTTAALKLQAEDPDRVLLISFSGLLTHTELTVKALAGWLDIDFDDSLLAPSFNGMAVRGRSSFGDVGTQMSSAPLARASELPQDVTSYIDTRARDLYEQAIASARSVESELAYRLD